MPADKQQRMSMLLELLTIAAEAESDREQMDKARDCLRRHGRTTPEMERRFMEAVAHSPSSPVRYH
jgi:hypothetical protein